MFWCHDFENVKEGSDQERAQSERNAHKFEICDNALIKAGYLIKHTVCSKLVLNINTETVHYSTHSGIS